MADEHKKLRFICRKGAVENDAIRWWRNEAEFADYVDRVHPEGYKPGQLKKEKKKEEFRYPSAVADEDKLPPATWANRRRMLEAKHPSYQDGDPKEPEPNDWRVYLIREETDRPCSYVGHTGRNGKLPEERLVDHNETHEKGKGADETRGTQWKICRVFYGFADERNAMSFEESINANEVECWQERLTVIDSIRDMAKWQWVREDPDYTDDDL